MVFKALFLDFYGTVVHEDGKIISIILSKIQKSLHSEASQSDIGHLWYTKFQKLCNNSYEANFKTQREIELLALRQTLNFFHSPLNETELCQLQFDYWKKPEIFADAADFLKQNLVPVYIVSNIDTADLKAAIAYHQLNHITDVITSESVKSYKPRTEMFHKALEKSNLSAEDVIHVGDSLTSDVAGAQSAGIKTVWLNRTRKINVHNKKPEYIIHSFDDLLNIIQ